MPTAAWNLFAAPDSPPGGLGLSPYRRITATPPIRHASTCGPRGGGLSVPHSLTLRKEG